MNTSAQVHSPFNRQFIRNWQLTKVQNIIYPLTVRRAAQIKRYIWFFKCILPLGSLSRSQVWGLMLFSVTPLLYTQSWPEIKRNDKAVFSLHWLGQILFWVWLGDFERFTDYTTCKSGASGHLAAKTWQRVVNTGQRTNLIMQQL